MIAPLFQRLEEFGILLRPPQELREPLGIAGGKEARIVITEESSTPLDSGCQDRHSGNDGLGDHVGAALHLRAQDEQATAAEVMARFPSGKLPKPAVAWILLLLATCASLHLVIESGANVGDVES